MGWGQGSNPRSRSSLKGRGRTWGSLAEEPHETRRAGRDQAFLCCSFHFLSTLSPWTMKGKGEGVLPSPAFPGLKCRVSPETWGGFEGKVLFHLTAWILTPQQPSVAGGGDLGRKPSLPLRPRHCVHPASRDLCPPAVPGQAWAALRGWHLQKEEVVSISRSQRGGTFLPLCGLRLEATGLWAWPIWTLGCWEPQPA